MQFKRAHLAIHGRLLWPVAALVLAIFAVAQGVCFVHCHPIKRTTETPVTSCHGKSSNSRGGSRENKESSAPQCPGPAFSCISLKTMLSSGDPAPVVPPILQVILRLPFLSEQWSSAELPGFKLIPRRAEFRDRTWTPEVYLGPALRSLAPPTAN
jgi:hypothetical protein